MTSKILILLALAGASWSLTADAREPLSIYVTSQQGDQRLALQAPAQFAALPQPSEWQQSIFVDPRRTFETLVGIGGAITDAAAETWTRLDEAQRARLIRAYFDPSEGIGYSLIRTNIHSCDFSSAMYTYVAEGDGALATFNIAPDRRHRLPMLRAALAAARAPLPVYASPWSPPGWMKDNGGMLHGGRLLPEWRDAWARYFVRFIEEYEKAGVPIWGVTVQNEPMAVQIWESCNFTAEEERDFIRDHLGPALHQAGLGSRKIIAWDHNRTQMYHRAATILSDPGAAAFVWGIGFHWYMNDSFQNVRLVRDAFPGVQTIMTEGCNGPFEFARMHDWELAEAYGRAMVHDLNNGAAAWTDWNILLDETGGPNHVGNFCFAPVHADTRTGELHFTPAYHYIGHFSKFIRPGARRVIASTTTDHVLTTAFLNLDGSLAVVVLNLTDNAEPLRLWLEGEAAEFTSPAHSIATLVAPAP